MDVKELKQNEQCCKTGNSTMCDTNFSACTSKL